jgi:hypothetical protein
MSMVRRKTPVNPEANKPETIEDEILAPERREMLEKFGKFAVYAAPFTVLAFAKRADAATSTGPGRHSVPSH